MKLKVDSQIQKNRKVGSYRQPLVLLILVSFLFGSMFIRLFWLQVLNGAFYKKLSNENRIRLVSSPPIRGRILDRNGNILADNKLSYSLSVQPRLITDEEWLPLSKKLSSLLNLSWESIDKTFRKGKKNSLYRITLIRDLTVQNVLRFKEQQVHLKGAQIDVDLIRYYPYKTLAAHALGYTQLITENEYSSLSEKGYKIKDYIGRRGIEAAYEDYLRGEWGGEMLEVDSIGDVQRSLGIRKPKAGKDLQLTIDIRMQRAAEDALSDKSAGAIVVLDPRTGAIRALASKPTYDPNFFSKSFKPQKEYNRLFFSSNLPLLSRAINAYDPGSTWKPVTSIAGMESGKFPKDIILETAPCIRYGSHCFPEHNKRGWGAIGYADALRVSSNTFFYQVGVGSGSKAHFEAAKKLGFNSLTGVELAAEESKGLVGNEEWASKGRYWGRPGTTPWIPEDMASASIGQAVVQVTPLQLARAYSVFANGGYLITPHFFDGDVNWLSSKYEKKVDIKASTLKTIRSGLRKVVQSGTGMSLNNQFPDLPPAAGKTGTAEDSSGGSDHAWFACFAPYESSEIVIVAFAQNTPGGGSVHALPMARKLLKIWVDNKGNDAN